ncbi:Glycosyltransferase involved in cell wall bisynthesis [Bacteroides luti]|uniref:Glycosyltransferase involved in cell wall bisynthesis n=1 Tax=Bacteroides luti TaxID=1297750 RepID=A0A1M4WIP2_9BACE|nr:glycosyltransferase [Bacteroides luti]SHE81096.1 Glycosyltransferase involved in cell wall bisynthesis [Bacteroides luti]
MDLIFATEGRFVRRKNGAIYSIDGGFTNALWDRYLNTFDRLYVLARVDSNDNTPINENYIASNEKVSFIDVPYFIGPFQYMKKKLQIRRFMEKNITNEFAYICRVPGVIGGEAIKILRKKRIPYAVEVVGDPWDVYAPGSINHPLRPFLRLLATYSLKKIVFESDCALYVTKNALQKRYPTRNDIFSISASDVCIKDSDIVEYPIFLDTKKVYNLISVGSLSQMYKSPDIALEAVAKLKKEGINCHLTWLGDGIYRLKMIELSEKLGIRENVEFKGNVPQKKVREGLLHSDIFLLVSRTEGLPRAVIEAMASGLPCIGTKVGGIPELLEDDVLIEPNNSDELVAIIKKMIRDLDFSKKQVIRNISESCKYKESILTEHRNIFFNKLIEINKK